MRYLNKNFVGRTRDLLRGGTRLACLMMMVCATTVCRAQQIDSLTLDTLRDCEIRLMGLAQSMIQSYDEETRLTSGRNFVKQLSRTLRVKNSWYYPFDSLRNVSTLKSPDNLFRIMTWNIATNDEKFRYFGVIQLNPEKTKRFKDTTNLRSFYPLIDRSDSINDPFHTETDAEHWWGAAYYKIIQTTSQRNTYYTLLGWDGATVRSNKKLADVLIFRNNKPVFGAPIFDVKGKAVLHRMIWEFNNHATMTLRYEDKKKMLIYENIVPSKPQNAGMYDTYIPDGSYDFMLWKKGKWERQSDIVRDFKME